MGPIGVVHTTRGKKDFQQRNGVASITPPTGADAKIVLTYVHATQDGVGEGDARQRWVSCEPVSSDPTRIVVLRF